MSDLSRSISLVGYFLMGGLTRLASAQARLEVECLLANVSSEAGRETFEVDCFAIPNMNQTWRGTQLKVDCPLRAGSGSLGDVNFIGGLRDPDNDGANGRAGGDPPINGLAGITAFNVNLCRVAATPSIGISFLNLTAGTRYFIITLVYEGSNCAAGEFTGFVVPGSYSDPPAPGDLSYSTNGNNIRIPLDVVDTYVTAQPSACCFEGQRFGDIEPAAGPLGGGAVDGDCDVDVDDIVCVQDAYAGRPPTDTCNSAVDGPADTDPCDADGRHGDGDVDVDDILKVLDAFITGGSTYPECVAPCPGCP